MSFALNPVEMKIIAAAVIVDSRYFIVLLPMPRESISRALWFVRIDVNVTLGGAYTFYTYISSRELRLPKFIPIRFSLSAARCFSIQMMGADTTLDLGVIEESFGLMLGVGNPVITSLDGEEVVCKKHAAITGFNRRVVHRRAAGGGILVVKITFSSLEQLIGDAIGGYPSAPIVFDRSINLSTGFGAQANLVVRALANLIQSDVALLDNPLIRTNFDEMLQSILLGLPHNYRDKVFDRFKPEAVPRIVQLAEQFIEAYASEALTIQNIVEACSTSRAVLFSTFKKFRGYTPMEFLAECRLQSARQALQVPSSTDTVSFIAQRCGFAHLGRFSQVYQKRFGESPSDTLRLAKSSIF